MRSVRVSSRVLSVGEDALDPRHLSASWCRSSRSDVIAGSCRAVFAARASRRLVGDEHSAARVGLHELFLAEHVECVADGHRRHAVMAGQVAARRQAVPGLYALLAMPARRSSATCTYAGRGSFVSGFTCIG